MGAGYTRWFREGGDIYPCYTLDTVPLPGCLASYTTVAYVIAKPVWPSKKTSILPDEMYPIVDTYMFSEKEFHIPAPRSLDHWSDKSTRFWDDLVIRKDLKKPGIISTVPHRDWLKDFMHNDDWYKNWKDNTYPMNEDQLNYYKKDTMPITLEEKKNRFLRAGGSFNKIPRNTDETLVPCNIQPCSIEPMFHLARDFHTVHYHHVMDVVNGEVKSERDHNFENILQNTEENVWVASRDRHLWIKDSMRYHALAKEVISDKHLVNTMRYLVTYWISIKDTIVNKYNEPEEDGEERGGTYAWVTVKHRRIAKTTSAPDLYNEILPCWPTLCNEVKERFGAEALTAILDGF